MVVFVCVVPRNSAPVTPHLNQLDDFIIRLNFSVNSVVKPQLLLSALVGSMLSVHIAKRSSKGTFHDVGTRCLSSAKQTMQHKIY